MPAPETFYYNLEGLVAAALTLPFGRTLRTSWVGYTLRGRTCLLDSYDPAVSIAVQAHSPAVFHIFVGAFLARVERLGNEPVEIFRVYRDLNADPLDEPFGGELLYAAEAPCRMAISFDHLAGVYASDPTKLAQALAGAPFDGVPEALRAPAARVNLTPRLEVYLPTCPWLPHPGISRSGSMGGEEQMVRAQRPRVVRVN